MLLSPSNAKMQKIKPWFYHFPFISRNTASKSQIKSLYFNQTNFRQRNQQLKFESIMKGRDICRFGRPDTLAVLSRHFGAEPVLPSVGRNVQPGDDRGVVHNPSPHPHVRLRCVTCRGLFPRNINVPISIHWQQILAFKLHHATGCQTRRMDSTSILTMRVTQH